MFNHNKSESVKESHNTISQPWEMILIAETVTNLKRVINRN